VQIFFIMFQLESETTKNKMKSPQKINLFMFIKYLSVDNLELLLYIIADYRKCCTSCHNYGCTIESPRELPKA
jgi:hypothetical protein